MLKVIQIVNKFLLVLSGATIFQIIGELTGAKGEAENSRTHTHTCFSFFPRPKLMHGFFSSTSTCYVTHFFSSEKGDGRAIFISKRKKVLIRASNTNHQQYALLWRSIIGRFIPPERIPRRGTKAVMAKK